MEMQILNAFVYKTNGFNGKGLELLKTFVELKQSLGKKQEFSGPQNQKRFKGSGKK